MNFKTIENQAQAMRERSARSPVLKVLHEGKTHVLTFTGDAWEYDDEGFAVYFAGNNRATARKNFLSWITN